MDSTTDVKKKDRLTMHYPSKCFHKIYSAIFCAGWLHKAKVTSTNIGNNSDK